jgi:hypothetical protein
VRDHQVSPVPNTMANDPRPRTNRATGSIDARIIRAPINVASCLARATSRDRSGIQTDRSWSDRGPSTSSSTRSRSSCKRRSWWAPFTVADAAPTRNTAYAPSNAKHAMITPATRNPNNSPMVSMLDHPVIQWNPDYTACEVRILRTTPWRCVAGSRAPSNRTSRGAFRALATNGHRARRADSLDGRISWAG